MVKRRQILMFDLDMLRTPLGAVVVIIAIQAAMAASGRDISSGY